MKILFVLAVFLGACRAGEARWVELARPALVAVEGTLHDTEGRPVGAREIWFVRAGLPMPKYFHGQEEIERRTWTDGEGRFTAEVARGSYWVGPGHDPEDARHAPWADFVLVTPGVAPVGLELRPALFIEGMVLEPDGSPATAASVSLYSEAVAMSVWAETGEAGRYRVGPLGPGRFSLTASSRSFESPEAASEPVDAAAGDTGVVLSLRPGGAVRGTIVREDGGELRDTEVRFFEAGREAFSWYLYPGEGGVRESPGLVPGVYECLVTTSDGLVGVVSAIEVRAGSTTEFEVRLGRGAVLDVSYSPRGTEDHAAISVHQGKALVAFDDGVERGSSVRLIVPEGELKLRATLSLSGASLAHELRVRAGEVVELEVEL